jgi:hypothetical protein
VSESTRCGCSLAEGHIVTLDPACALHNEDQSWADVLVDVAGSIAEERYEQVKRYGLNDECADGTGPWVPWIPLGCSGVSAAAIEYLMRNDYEDYKESTSEPPTWLHLVREELAEAFKELPNLDNEKLDVELLQVAALCAAWVESRRRRRTQRGV